MGNDLEIAEFLTARHNGKTSGYILTNQGFFHITDASIIDGKIVVGTMYGVKQRELESV